MTPNNTLTTSPPTTKPNNKTPPTKAHQRHPCGRSGKFIEIQFDAQAKMSGARIHVYLLEKSRLVAQAQD